MSTLLSPQRNRQTLIRWGLMLVALGALQPWLWQVVTSQAEDLQNSRTKEVQLSHVKEQVSALSSQLEQQAAQLRQLDGIAPKTDSLTTLLGRIEQIANRTRVTMEIVAIDNQITNVSEAAVLQPVTLTLQATGGAQATVDFLRAIEQSPEVTVVTGWSLVSAVQFDAVGQPVPNATHELQVQVVYFLRQV